MSDLSFIKLKLNMFDDEKIRIIETMPEGDSIIIVWVKLLIMAGKHNMDGVIMLTEKIPYSRDGLVAIIGRKNSIIDAALTLFCNMEMITIEENGAILINNWEKHQSLNKGDIQREKGRERVKRFRNKQLMLNDCNAKALHVTLPVTECNASETGENIRIREYKNIEKEETLQNNFLIINSIHKDDYRLLDIEIKQKRAHDMWQEMISSEQWQEDVARLFKKTPVQIRIELKEFLNEIKAKDMFYQNLSELKEYFVNWNRKLKVA